MQTVKQIRDAIASKETTAAQVIQHFLSVIHEKNPDIHALVEVFEEEAKEAARKIDAMVAEGKPLPRLAGVPIAIKDNMLFKGHIAAAGSGILLEHVSAYTGTAVQRLIDAGAIIIGRANMDDAAMGSSTETSVHGITKNPIDPERIPGGSSGGSAAAVAAGMVPAALGSDTGGSIRQPAAMCGVVGMKPSYGRVSRYGLIAMASSLDQIGAFAHTAEDVALIHEVIEGRDEHDATSRNVELTIAELLNTNVAGLKIGVPKEFFIEGMDPEVRKAVESGIQKLKEAGAEIVEISLPLSKAALPTYYITQPAEASSNVARYDGMRYGTRAPGTLLNSFKAARGAGFGKEVKRRILLGTFILSAGYRDAFYKKAQAVRTAMKDEMEKAFESVDLIVAPTTPSVAWKLGEKMDDPVSMYLSDVLTTTANMVGIPAISVPVGNAHDLPVGMQIMGPVDGDALVLRAAHAFEQLNDGEAA